MTTRKAPVTLLIATFLAALASPPAYAGFIDGNELYDICTKGINARGPTHFQDHAQCAGYIEGVVDTSSTGDCLPENVKISQLMDIAHDYLRSHAATRHRGASYLVESAIREAFCAK